MRLIINHTTQYDYEVPATYALQQIRIKPQTTAGQTVLSWDMQLTGAEVQASFRDEHGNLVDLVELSPGATQVRLSVSGEIETHDTNGVVGRHMLAMPLWFYLRQTKLTQPGGQVRALVEAVGSVDDRVAALHRLSAAIRDRVAYETGETGVDTTAEDALLHQRGVCQDHTHIFLSAARELGFPARYVSGYLMMNDRIEQEASHAWAEAHVNGLGWIGIDVSNAISPDERYVQVARGLDYASAAPTSGFVVGAQQENLIVSVQVQQ
ncbi:MAG: transglutaminase family protein [Pseudomonadota bacterium]